MKQFDLKSGTTVAITDTIVEIIRTSGKSAMKGLFAGRVMGYLSIKLSAISGVQFFGDYLIIYASGLPSADSFKISNIAEIKEFPNCIVAKSEELVPVYQALTAIMMGTPIDEQ